MPDICIIFSFKVTLQRFGLYRVKDPVAFKKRNGNQGRNAAAGPFTQVVIFTEIGGGHFNNDVFHAFQVNCLNFKLFDDICIY